MSNIGGPRNTAASGRSGALKTTVTLLVLAERCSSGRKPRHKRSVKTRKTHATDKKKMCRGDQPLKLNRDRLSGGASAASKESKAMSESAARAGYAVR